MRVKNTLIIAEWQRFGVEDIEKEGISPTQARKIFAELVDFAHQEGNHRFLKFKNSNTLVAQNYVGIIQTKSGFCVEILPKTFYTANKYQGFEVQQDESKKQESIESAKVLLLKMLNFLKDFPFKQSNFAYLKLANMPLLEVFILMFLQELENLVKKGLKSSYVVQEENCRFLKGKLLFNQNLKYNFSHKERFFTASDEFSSNIAPNCLIKSTLEFLNKQNLSSQTSARLAQMRFIFADIAPSQNIQRDFSECQNLRHFKHYELILLWCEVFLKQHGFLPYQATSKAYALLFDMNKLFESFVASKMKKWSRGAKLNNEENEELMKQIFEKVQNFSLTTQEQSKYLAQNKKQDNMFLLKPDIVCKDSQVVYFIADTKWKILKSSKNYGISQSDMYQIFAYLAKYQCKKGFLIYPKIGEGQKSEIFEFKPKISNDTISLTICFFSLS